MHLTEGQNALVGIRGTKGGKLMEYAPGQNLETFSGVEEALKPLDKLAAASLYAPEPEYVVTLSELLTCYEQAHKASRKAKKAFPGSRVVRVAKIPFDDPLPF